MGQLLLGIDIGTTGCKTALYNLDGKEAAQSYREYKLSQPMAGRAEQDPEDWWQAAVDTTRDVLGHPGIQPSQVCAVGISCTNALLAVDAEGMPLLPAILMIDQRSIPQADWIKKNIGEEHVFSITGNRVAPGAFSAPIMRWIWEERPDLYRQVHRFLVPSGFIVHRLTGKFTIDTSRASGTMLLDIKSRKWSDSLCDDMNIASEKLPCLLDSFDVAGYITQKAAALTGLKPGIPVIAGCVDTISAAIGAGAVKPGQTFGILGTVGRVCVVTNGSHFDKRMMNFCHGLPDCCLTTAAVNSTGATLRWFRDTLYQHETLLANEQGRSPYALMMEEAATANPGANGMIYLPYLAGERSPIWNGDAKAVLFGLTLAHKKPDIIRALIEGVAFAIRHNLEIIRDEYDVSFTKMILGGGGAKGRQWCQIVGDVTHTDILIPEVFETEALGSALLAGVGCGLYSDVHEAVKRAVRIAEELHYDEQRAQLYDKYFTAYLQLVTEFEPQFTQLANLTRTGKSPN